MGDTFKAERTTQICIDKIISVTKGMRFRLITLKIQMVKLFILLFLLTENRLEDSAWKSLKSF